MSLCDRLNVTDTDASKPVLHLLLSSKTPLRSTEFIREGIRSSPDISAGNNDAKAEPTADFKPAVSSARQSPESRFGSKHQESGRHSNSNLYTSEHGYKSESDDSFERSDQKSSEHITARDHRTSAKPVTPDHVLDGLSSGGSLSDVKSLSSSSSGTKSKFDPLPSLTSYGVADRYAAVAENDDGGDDYDFGVDTKSELARASIHGTEKLQSRPVSLPAEVDDPAEQDVDEDIEDIQEIEEMSDQADDEYNFSPTTKEIAPEGFRMGHSSVHDMAASAPLGDRNSMSSTKAVRVAGYASDEKEGSGLGDERKFDGSKVGVSKIRTTSSRSATGWEVSDDATPEDDDYDFDDGDKVLADLNFSNSKKSRDSKMNDFDHGSRHSNDPDVDDSFESELNISDGGGKGLMPGRTTGTVLPSLAGQRSFMSSLTSNPMTTSSAEPKLDVNSSFESDRVIMQESDSDEGEDTDELMISRRSNQEDEEDYVQRHTKNLSTGGSWGQRVGAFAGETTDGDVGEINHRGNTSGNSYDDSRNNDSFGDEEVSINKSGLLSENRETVLPGQILSERHHVDSDQVHSPGVEEDMDDEYDAYDEDFEADGDKNESILKSLSNVDKADGGKGATNQSARPKVVKDDEVVEEIDSEVPEEDDISMGDQVSLSL
jgi:hypothetical protein